MLVLSRKTGERINIGSDIFIEVRRVSGSRVTLAVHAPREVRILRGELKIAAEEFEETEELDESAGATGSRTYIVSPQQVDSTVLDSHHSLH